MLQKTKYVLRADFVTYNNSLHAYWNAMTGKGSCCDGNDFPTNCSDPCETSLRYCFKKYGTQNDITEDGNIASDCLGIRTSDILQEPIDYIDYSMPPLTLFNTTSPTSLTLSSGEPWPVSWLPHTPSLIHYLSFSLTGTDATLCTFSCG